METVSKRTRYLLYAFIASQPLPLLFLALDQSFHVLQISRGGLFLWLAIPWGLAVVTALSALAELGLNTGKNWVRWALGLVVIYGVQAYALKEIYLYIIVPINFIIFPLLALGLSHLLLRKHF